MSKGISDCASRSPAVRVRITFDESCPQRHGPAFVEALETVPSTLTFDYRRKILFQIHSPDKTLRSLLEELFSSAVCALCQFVVCTDGFSLPLEQSMAVLRDGDSLEIYCVPVKEQSLVTSKRKKKPKKKHLKKTKTTATVEGDELSATKRKPDAPSRRLDSSKPATKRSKRTVAAADQSTDSSPLKSNEESAADANASAMKAKRKKKKRKKKPKTKDNGGQAVDAVEQEVHIDNTEIDDAVQLASAPAHADGDDNENSGGGEESTRRGSNYTEPSWKRPPMTEEGIAAVDAAIQWIDNAGNKGSNGTDRSDEGSENFEQPEFAPDPFGYKRPYEVIASDKRGASRTPDTPEADHVPLSDVGRLQFGDEVRFQLLEQDAESFLPVLSAARVLKVTAFDSSNSTATFEDGNAYSLSSLANAFVVRGPSLDPVNRVKVCEKPTIRAVQSPPPRGVSLTPEQEARAMAFFSRCDDSVPRRERLRLKAQIGRGNGSNNKRRNRARGRGRGRLPSSGARTAAAPAAIQPSASQYRSTSSIGRGRSADMSEILRMIAAQRHKVSQN